MLNIIIILLFTSFHPSLATNDILYESFLGLRTEKPYCHPPEVYDINLDLHFEDRWKKVIADKGNYIADIYKYLLAIAKIPEDIIYSINYTVVASHDLEYADELLALSKMVSIDFEKIALLNVFFDAAPECLGIVVQDVNGNILHGRNLDYYDSEKFIPWTFEARFWKNGRMIYKEMKKIGTIGILTATKQGSFSVSLNQYSSNQDPPKDVDVWETVKYIVKGIYDEYLTSYKSFLLPKTEIRPDNQLLAKHSPLYTVRVALETSNTYDEIVDCLIKWPTFSNVIYVVSGIKKNEGIVITRSTNSVLHIERLNVEEGIWFLAQANYQRDLPDWPFDNRREGAEGALRQIGREKINKETLLNDVLKRYPMWCNGTIHSTVMQAKTGDMKTTMWGWKEAKNDDLFDSVKFNGEIMNTDL